MAKQDVAYYFAKTSWHIHHNIIRIKSWSKTKCSLNRKIALAYLLTFVFLLLKASSISPADLSVGILLRILLQACRKFCRTVVKQNTPF